MSTCQIRVPWVDCLPRRLPGARLRASQIALEDLSSANALKASDLQWVLRAFEIKKRAERNRGRERQREKEREREGERERERERTKRFRERDAIWTFQFHC